LRYGYINIYKVVNKETKDYFHKEFANKKSDKALRSWSLSKDVGKWFSPKFREFIMAWQYFHFQIT